MSEHSDWFRDLAEAAESLGYRIASVTPSKIELHSYRIQSGVVLTIDSIFLSGDLLRRVLAEQPALTRVVAEPEGTHVAGG